ncbi:MAG TPA: hypothetical protein VG873_17720 [Burkholderiales bacterium]|nr:hypothetical protein [Burkholderiales bacterium]
MSKTGPDPEASRAETVTAALLYLMTHYARTGCPRLAVCISRHMQCLAAHPDAAPVVRNICASLHGPWAHAAEGATATHDATVH